MAEKKAAPPESADEFERYLFAEIRSGEIHFPKALISPADEAGREGEERFVLLRGLLRPPAPWLLIPVFAYALVLLLLWPAYRGLFPGRPEAAPARLRGGALPAEGANVVAVPAPAVPSMGAARSL